MNFSGLRNPLMSVKANMRGAGWCRINMKLRMLEVSGVVQIACVGYSNGVQGEATSEESKNR